MFFSHVNLAVDLGPTTRQELIVNIEVLMYNISIIIQFLKTYRIDDKVYGT